MSKSPVTSVTILLAPISDPKTGVLTHQWMKWFQQITDAVNSFMAPVDAPAVAHQWLTGYDATTGDFSQSQPAYGDLTGTPTGASGTITLEALTPGTGTMGSITVVNGIITAFVNPT